MAVATQTARGYLTATGSQHEPDPATDNDAGVDDEAPGATVLEPGVFVDRYCILEVVGSGGIGVVYAAFDEALGRNVALKLLRPSARSSRKFERRRARLIREAQALARLSHPNVVPVYEVGMFEDRVFLAMEYIEGSTMRRWLRRSPRTWEEILDKYLQAGRGLAAAHAADIVHRDFKPDNVLVGEDGRVRVLDFGLATPVPEALATGRYATLTLDDQHHEGAQARGRPQALTDSVAALVTAHGKVMGTPAYMSPEQSRSEAIDARADQYSFCVALWEALFGERPHGPPTSTARIRLHRRLSERRLSEFGGAGIDVPQSVQRALERGLSADPVDRFPNMDGLLAALSPKTSTWRLEWRRWMLAGTLPLAGALALLVGALTPDTAQTCPRELDALDSVWDDDVRERARARLTATQRPYAQATWDTIERELDRWSTRWHDARVDACEDTKVRQQQSTVLLDMRMACLDRQKNALAAVTESLAADSIRADEVDRRLETALSAVLTLPDPERCERSALVGGGKLLHEDPRLDDQLEEQRQRLARARGLLDMAKHDDALAIVDEIVASTSADGPASAADLFDGNSQPLVAEVELLRGQILAKLGKLDDAEHDLRYAMLIAQTTGHDAVTVEACATLVDVLSSQGELDSAGDWAALGHATLARLGGDPHLEATLRFAGARLARVRGQLDVALRDQVRVLELRQQLYGSEHVEVAKALTELVSTKTALGFHDEAEADIERALEILRTELGVTHPEVALAYARYAALARARGDERDALSKLHEALSIFELAFDEQHPQVAETLAAIAATRMALGEHEPALAALGRALSIEVARDGEQHPKLAPMLVDIGALHHALGHDDDAEPPLTRALELLQDAAPDDDEARALRARATMALTKVTWSKSAKNPRQRAQARDLARAAISEFTTLDMPIELESANSWLAHHGG